MKKIEKIECFKSAFTKCGGNLNDLNVDCLVSKIKAFNTPKQIKVFAAEIFFRVQQDKEYNRFINSIIDLQKENVVKVDVDKFESLRKQKGYRDCRNYVFNNVNFDKNNPAHLAYLISMYSRCEKYPTELGNAGTF